MAAMDLADIQGNIVTAYRVRNARHFILTFGTARGAGNLLSLLVSGDTDKAPQVSRASEHQDGASYRLNLSLTADGLRVLGLPESVMSLFPRSYLRGPAYNAGAMGDDGPGDPSHWAIGGPANPAVHAIVSLYSNEHKEPVMDRLTAWLRSIFSQNDAEVTYQQDGKALDGNRVHFNFRDGIAQPQIAGAPGERRPDMQPDSSPGEFLLGKDYVNQFNGNFIDDLPAELADNGSYGAFRMLRQQVFDFEDFVSRAATRYGMDPELVAAKMVGRWRNGTPLSLSPTQNTDMPLDKMNDFDYAPTPEHPQYFDDDQGMRCPIGSHLRRMNPRSALVMGKPHTRRIIRRNHPFGPPIKPGDPRDDIERGLVGFFICGDLQMQFEFLQKIWANMDFATTGLRGTRDPIIGAHPEHGGQFVIRTQSRADPIIFDAIPRLVVTRGSAYCFFPSITGLRFLASVPG